MDIHQNLLKLRVQWFKLSTKEFLQRYQNGFILLVLLLPGVAVGDNLYLFFKGLTIPFIQITGSQTQFLDKFLWLVVLHAIFVTFCLAQKTAITGGNFSTYMQSLPLTSTVKNKLNVWLMLLANHFLWVTVLASFYYQFESSDLGYLKYFKNALIVFLLLTAQYVALFKLNFKYVMALLILNLILLLNVSKNLVWVWCIFLIVCWTVLTLQLLKPSRIYYKKPTKDFFNFLSLKSNFYFQMLFRANTTSTYFRLMIVVLLIVGFKLVSNNLAGNNSGELFPYALAFEALLAYYLSGFYVCFNDQRQFMHDLLISLPVPKFFWFIRDFLTVIILSLLAHMLLYILLLHVLNAKQLSGLFSYYVALLLVSYPIRIFVNRHQTSLTFVVLIIITAITLFNIS